MMVWEMYQNINGDDLLVFLVKSKAHYLEKVGREPTVCRLHIDAAPGELKLAGMKVISEVTTLANHVLLGELDGEGEIDA